LVPLGAQESTRRFGTEARNPGDTIMTVTKAPPSRANVLREEANKRVWGLQTAVLDPHSHRNAEATATLARLRRCDPNEPGSDPSVWQVTLADLPEELRWDNASSPAERALHASLVLYAVHQQSNGAPIHQVGQGLGDAVRNLAAARGHDGAPDEATIRRLHQVVLADEPAGRLYHLRGLIGLFRSEAQPIPLDYAQLAVDLWRLFDPNQDHNSVVAQWGRDLHNRPRTTGESE
jgi:CRISPR system Cascade subunit CasB